MKRIVTIDNIFPFLRIEAVICGASVEQVEAIVRLENMTKPQEDYDPYRRSEVDIQVVGVNLSILMSKADAEGNLIANGEWCRITVYPDGTLAMTTSHEPEHAWTLSPPVTGYN